jgi:hypothetical protein
MARLRAAHDEGRAAMRSIVRVVNHGRMSPAAARRTARRLFKPGEMTMNTETMFQNVTEIELYAVAGGEDKTSSTASQGSAQALGTALLRLIGIALAESAKSTGTCKQ